MALVASIPYGRMFHLFASPLAIAVNLARPSEGLPHESRTELGAAEPVHAGKTR
jgi:hypothetical protein